MNSLKDWSNPLEQDLRIFLLHVVLLVLQVAAVVAHVVLLAAAVARVVHTAAGGEGLTGLVPPLHHLDRSVAYQHWLYKPETSSITSRQV